MRAFGMDGVRGGWLAVPMAAVRPGRSWGRLEQP